MKLSFKIMGLSMFLMLQACGGSGDSSGSGQPGSETPIEPVTQPQIEPDTDPLTDPADGEVNPPVADPDPTNPVTEPNSAPVLDGQVPNIEIEQSVSVTYDLANRFSDPDGDTLTFQLGDVSLPNGLELDENAGTVSGTADAPGDTDGLVLIATDSGGKSVRSNPFEIRVYKVSRDCAVFEQTGAEQFVSQVSETHVYCVDNAVFALKELLDSEADSADSLAIQLSELLASLPVKRIHVPTMILLRMMDEMGDSLGGEARAQIYNQLKASLYDAPVLSEHRLFLTTAIQILNDHFADACSVDSQPVNCTVIMLRLMTEDNSSVNVGEKARDTWVNILEQSTEIRELDFSVLLSMLISDNAWLRQTAIDLSRSLLIWSLADNSFDSNFLDETLKVRLLSELAAIYTGELSPDDVQDHSLGIAYIFDRLAKSGFGPPLLAQVDSISFDPNMEYFKLRESFEDFYMDPAEECFRTNTGAPDTTLQVRWPLGNAVARKSCETLFLPLDFLWSITAPETRQIVEGGEDHDGTVLILPNRAKFEKYLELFLDPDSFAGIYMHEEFLANNGNRNAYMYLQHREDDLQFSDELLAHELTHYYMYRHLIRPDGRGLDRSIALFNEGLPEYVSVHSGGTVQPDQGHVSTLCRRGEYPSLADEASRRYFFNNGLGRYDIFYSGIYFLMTRYPEEFKQILTGMRNGEYQNNSGVVLVQGELVFDFDVLNTEYWSMLDSSEWCA